MRVLLVGPDSEDNLSIRYLSAALHAAGHEGELSAFNSAADLDGVVDDAVEIRGRVERRELALVPRRVQRGAEVADRQIVFAVGPHEQHTHEEMVGAGTARLSTVGQTFGDRYSLDH